MTRFVRPIVQRLPTTREEFVALRRNTGMSIIDHTQAFVDEMFEDQEFNSLINVVFDPEAKHGSVRANFYVAAMQVIEKAKERDAHHPVATAKLETIKRAINRVLTRGGVSPKQRKRAGYVLTDDSEAAE